MSYTRPSSSAADATFVGAAAYTRPSASAAHAYFPIEPREVSGFKPTHFGVPNVLPGYVPGFKATTFGTPVGYQKWDAASLGPLIKFSWTQTGAATGLASTTIGAPIAFSIEPPSPVGQICSASSLLPVHFGTPVVPSIGVATGALMSSFGQPAAQRRQTVTGVLVPNFGTSSVRLKQRVSGFAPTHIGAPVVRLVQQASWPAVKTRFGTPAAEIVGTHRVTMMFPLPAFGRPKAASGSVKQATGISMVSFGAPSIRQRHRVTMMPPAHKFGTPVVRRSTEC